MLEALSRLHTHARGIATYEGNGLNLAGGLLVHSSKYPMESVCARRPTGVLTRGIVSNMNRSKRSRVAKRAVFEGHRF
jgi:hypothetical protein